MSDNYTIAIDTHTHTFVSGHAYSSLLENVAAAKARGLYGIVMTEHGPAMPCGAPDFVLGTYGIIPEFIDGVRIYRGTETNILNGDGVVDIESRFLKKGDFILASMHDVVIDTTNPKTHTRAMIKALENPYVDCLGHPGHPAFPHDVAAVVAAAKRLGKVIEINNHSFTYRKGCTQTCEQYIDLCRDNGVRIAVGSDAHFVTDIGAFDITLEKLKEHRFPPELIINRSRDAFEEYLEFKRERMAEQVTD